jgi:hypothetical protein
MVAEKWVTTSPTEFLENYFEIFDFMTEEYIEHVMQSRWPGNYKIDYSQLPPKVVFADEVDEVLWWLKYGHP